VEEKNGPMPSEAGTGLPPQAVLYRLATGHYVSRALALAAKLGIADRVAAGRRSVDELATATETQPGALRRVLRLLVSAGVFAEDEHGEFELTPLGECLRVDVPGSAHAMVRLFGGDRVQDSWKELEYCVRTGEPAYRKRGVTDPFAEIAEDPDEAANFDAAMATFTQMTARAVAAAYDFTPFRTLVDVGGGTGALLIGILAANPHSEGIVFDLPHVAERANAEIERAEIGDRCRVIGGDFFDEVPAGGDAYLLKHVIHDWDDDRATTILGNCHRAMGPRGRLLVIEGVYPERVDQSVASRGAAANDVNMLVATGGRQRTEPEFRDLYARAGFTLERIVPTPMANVIEGSVRA